MNDGPRNLVLLNCSQRPSKCIHECATVHISYPRLYRLIIGLVTTTARGILKLQSADSLSSLEQDHSSLCQQIGSYYFSSTF